MRAATVIAVVITVVVASAAGCMKKDPLFCGKHPSDPSCAIDAAPGDGVDALDGSLIDARACFGGGGFEVCLTLPPTQAFSFTDGGTVDTDTFSNCVPGAVWTDASQPPACVVAFTTITIPSIKVTGSRPLVLLGTTSVTINGTLDAASHVGVGGTTGPASPFSGCLPGTIPTTNNNTGGGGAGASFTSVGGDGGNGGTTTKGTAAMQDAANPLHLRAGCDGQTGADGSAAMTGGKGGHGGGAVFVVAGSSISIGAAGIINVSGGGAAAAPATQVGGGGGGGSGGMLALYAPSIIATATSKLVANGGGGGGGAKNSGGAGTAGGDPNPATPGTSPTGGGPSGGSGCGNNNGGVGYSAASDGQPGGNGTNGSCGGGGGGGAGGYIQANVAITGLSATNASPTVTVQ